VFGFKNQSFKLVLEWPVLETKRLKPMKTLSDKAIEELKEVLRRDIGDHYVNLLSNDDLQQAGVFFLTILAESYRRRTNTHPHRLI
jgi:hypothetical protein